MQTHDCACWGKAFCHLKPPEGLDCGSPGKARMDAMISAEIQCTYCGLKGEIGGFNREPHDGHVKIFKHLGHNPFSGHLHYQCPSCSVVLLVPPMDVLEGKFLQGFPSPPENRDSILENLANLFNKFTRGRKFFQNTMVFR